MMALYSMGRRFDCLHTGAGMLGVRIGPKGDPKLAWQSSDLVKPIRDIGGVAVQAKMTALRLARPLVHAWTVLKLTKSQRSVNFCSLDVKGSVP
jgi:hypothetical protein